MWMKLDRVEVAESMAEFTGTNIGARVDKFLNHINENVDEDELINVARGWQTLGDDLRSKTALNFAGIYYTSLFYILMNCLSEKFELGSETI